MIDKIGQHNLLLILKYEFNNEEEFCEPVNQHNSEIFLEAFEFIFIVTVCTHHAPHKNLTSPKYPRISLTGMLWGLSSFPDIQIHSKVVHETKPKNTE